jgi:diguanylate cyclase (GGDEF)-like protein
MYGRPRPRSRTFPLAGAVLALAVPAGLLTIRGVLAGPRMTLTWAVADLARLPEVYAYVTISTMILFVALGHLLGRLVDRLVLLSNTDPLTGLLNRRRFHERLEDEIGRCRRFGRTASVLCVDVDRLKSVNDRFGHAAGDLALCTVARTLTDGTRTVDAVARIGGDEFAVLLPETTPSQALAVCRRLLAVAGVRDDSSWRPAISIGVAEVNGSAGLRPDMALADADAALYQAKAAGGARVMVSGVARMVQRLGSRAAATPRPGDRTRPSG